jgi:peptidoglycan/LPS O-acetylase OafA/YrhL
LGVYRFLLAIGVVAFHVGGGWVIGRAAVFAFYFVSGFLISRVLDTSYRGGVDRLAAFYFSAHSASCRFISLSHFMVAGLLMWITEAVGLRDLRPL